MINKVFILLLGVLITVSTQAATGIRDNLEIKMWHPASTNRPSSPANQTLTRVYFTESAAWGSTSCREDSADIIYEDDHILSSMLMAFAANKRVKVEVEDSLPKVNSVCKISAVYIYK